jgi:predicted  nucleic acid-binding Zn-ribbon protein
MEITKKLEDVMSKQEEVTNQIKSLDEAHNKVAQQYQQTRAVFLESLIELRGQERLLKDLKEEGNATV